MLRAIRPDHSGFVWLHRVTDILLPTSLLLALTVLLNIPWQERYLTMGLLGGFVFVIASQMVGVYRSWRGRSLFASAKLILNAWLLTWATLIVIAFLYKDSENFSRLAVTLWAIITPVVLIGYRVTLRTVLAKYRMHGNNTKTIAIIGAGKVGQHIANIIQTNPWLGYRVCAFYDDNTELHDTQINDIPVKGCTNKIGDIVNQNQYSEIYICLPLRAEHKIKQILNELTDTTSVVKFVPDLFTFDLMHAKTSELKGIPVFSVYDTPLSSTSNQIIKRLEDVVFSSIILVLISPILLWIAFMVKKSSPGPVLFKQKRYGLNGKEIKVYKFRSMTTQDNGTVIKQATQNDPRVTAFGAFIRRTSLDELPQFINVLQGKMSIVGPRPHAVAHNEEYRKLVPKYMQRHLVKPGITGWAQINGWRGETDTLEKMEKRVQFDLHYINNWSLWLDIRIIILTLFKGFVNKNAY
ncbi:undecaprenyl-phosphate glucose phosphotransferase [Thiomicrospira sp. S5]|uniref:undecaprenyl-phosphate glucose phosphotransferase n=1 Tax=Thiomicrospira sp. S5 TaxID=1803865 RepID=UPI000F8A1E6C|nr:undecaprenyl-phosphate glucose phosphotransferase [Thiomicrospira sp. S5]AZR81701.1 UDP-glucose lipid carrier transferase [Thiomicrospira sp. S5]